MPVKTLIHLPDFIKLYDHTYLTLPEATPSFPWADGKPPADRKRRNSTFTVLLLGKACNSKVPGAFVWPVFSTCRLPTRIMRASGRHPEVDVTDARRPSLRDIWEPACAASWLPWGVTPG